MQLAGMATAHLAVRISQRNQCAITVVPAWNRLAKTARPLQLEHRAGGTSGLSGEPWVRPDG
jgi:hypothetical protein